MYFFYFDESGSRDPSVGTTTKPKGHLYVLLAVGMYERQWKPFETELSGLKIELSNRLLQKGAGRFDLADCEVKYNWIRNPQERQKRSPFLHALTAEEIDRLTQTYFRQVAERKMVIIAAVVDKRYLLSHMTHETMHKKAYEFVLERIQNFVREYHRKHQAMVVMDDTSRQLNRAVAMKHSFFQMSGNQNMSFSAIVEYPFFTRSELSNGVQLADLLAYNVYRAFRDENPDYPYFAMMIPHIYRSRNQSVLHGLKVWPEASPLVKLSQNAWETYKQEALGANTNNVGLGKLPYQARGRAPDGRV